jgi:hypothetical protein
MIRVGDAPLRLLRKVRSIDLVELPNAENAVALAAPSPSKMRYIDGDAWRQGAQRTEYVC